MVRELSDKLLLCEGCWSHAQMRTPAVLAMLSNDYPLHPWHPGLAIEISAADFDIEGEAKSQGISRDRTIGMVQSLSDFKANPEWGDFPQQFKKLLINGEHIEHGRKWRIYIPVTARAPKRNMANIDGTPRIELQPTGWTFIHPSRL